MAVQDVQRDSSGNAGVFHKCVIAPASADVPEPEVLALEELKPLGVGVVLGVVQPRHDVRVRVVVVPVLVAGCVAPVHVERPDVDRQRAVGPARDVALGLRLRVRVPVREPGTAGQARCCNDQKIKRENAFFHSQDVCFSFVFSRHQVPKA